MQNDVENCYSVTSCRFEHLVLLEWDPGVNEYYLVGYTLHILNFCKLTLCNLVNFNTAFTNPFFFISQQIDPRTDISDEELSSITNIYNVIIYVSAYLESRHL